MKQTACLSALLALALSACGDSTSEPAPAQTPAAAASPAASYASAGTYRSATATGSAVVVTLAADGRYTITSGGEAAEAGRWRDGGGGACLAAEGGFSETCFAIAPGTDPATRLVTDPGGAVLTYDFEA